LLETEESHPVKLADVPVDESNLRGMAALNGLETAGLRPLEAGTGRKGATLSLNR
jgi:hypothetical protein